MKRKKWSELEEQTLLSKYSDLLTSGTLSKLKTREKKFRPVADHVNTIHHLQDPISYPFKWSWRDVSIKVQNMRHQYLGVKQKIRISRDEFNWKDGENHWENFLKYKEVFGDVELEVKSKKLSGSGGGDSDLFKDCGDLGFGIDSDDYLEEDDQEEEDGEEEGDVNGDDGNDHVGGGGGGEDDGEFGGEKGNGEMGIGRKAKMKKGFGGNRRLGLLGAQVMDLRDVVLRREEKRREREFNREKSVLESEGRRRELEYRSDIWRSEKEERVENWEMDLEERELMWARREFDRRVRVERKLGLGEEKDDTNGGEEGGGGDGMAERMLGMQIEHEKATVQIYADACQNQMQILGVMARFICRYFGSEKDGIGGGLGGLPPQVLQSLQHPGGLGDSEKPDANPPSELI